jgi:hypothetical protein
MCSASCDYMYTANAINKEPYAFYASSALAAMAAIVTFSPIIATFSIIFILSGALIHSHGRIINNLLVSRSAIIEVYNGYKLHPNLNSAVKCSGNLYSSVSVAEMPNTNAAANMDLRKLAENSSFPFEVAVRIEEMDKRKFIEPLETRKKRKEILLSRLASKNSPKALELSRTISILDDEISSIASSPSILHMKLLLRTFSVSESEHSAAKESSENMKALASRVSSLTGSDINIIKGEEIFNAGVL